MNLPPWESELGKTLWKSSTQFWSFIRGKLRLAWNNHPMKISVINKSRYQIKNPNLKGKKPTVWGFDCAMCGETFPISEGQVDHITPAGALSCREDIQGFVERLLCVTEDDLRLVCKGCNSALALAQKTGKTYDVCIIEKKAIDLNKTKQDKAFLESKGIKAESSQAKRRKQIVEYLTKEGEKND